jgi:putative phosphoribosyl transferase
MERFADRYAAGKVLASMLQSYAKNPDVYVLALPRGGVPVAYEIARSLSVPLDVFIVRKLGVPDHEELAMGAIASGGAVVFNEDILEQLRISESALDQVISAEEKELKRRELAYRGSRPALILKNKIVILVDDGIATGATVTVAIQAIKKQKPKRLILAVPVASTSIIEKMVRLVDEVICPLSIEPFSAVGAWYDDFSQITDDEVFHLLKNK